jgi:hypothetical protein
MLEIFLVIAMAKAIGKNAAAKGHSGIPYQILLVILWIVGEIGGLLIGVVITEAGSSSNSSSSGEGADFCFPYICALIGAGCGAGIAFGVVGLLPEGERRRRPDDDFDDRPRRRDRYSDDTGRRDFDDQDNYLPRSNSGQGAWGRDLPTDATDKFGDRLNRPPRPRASDSDKSEEQRKQDDLRRHLRDDLE